MMWASAFWALDRGRPVSWSGPLPIPPRDIFEIVDRLRLPCDYDEAIMVLSSLDDALLETRKPKRR